MRRVSDLDVHFRNPGDFRDVRMAWYELLQLQLRLPNVNNIRVHYSQYDFYTVEPQHDAYVLADMLHSSCAG